MKKEKMNTGFLVVMILFVAVTVAAFALAGHIYGVNSVFNRSVTTNVFVDTLFHKIPALINTIQIVTVAYALNWAIHAVLHRVLARSNRGKTVTTLVTSFLKYVIAIVAFLMVLSAWGADTRAILASAGILGLIIGLGAQSLIADILAGVFIVFEGEFQVGDIIVIDGWRGTVEEIGIRTTKIKDAGGNIKIINNSEISSVINQTKELSLAKARISIEYGQSIPQVELVIKNHLEAIREAIPEIKEGPYYKGVDTLGESSVDLLFIAKCKEEDLYGVQRALNRELKIMFDENGINIPFPQVTVSHLETSETPAGNKRADGEARAFVADQRERSKELEDRRS